MRGVCGCLGSLVWRGFGIEGLWLWMGGVWYEDVVIVVVVGEVVDVWMGGGGLDGEGLLLRGCGSGSGNGSGSDSDSSCNY